MNEIKMEGGFLRRTKWVLMLPTRWNSYPGQFLKVLMIRRPDYSLDSRCDFFHTRRTFSGSGIQRLRIICWTISDYPMTHGSFMAWKVIIFSGVAGLVISLAPKFLLYSDLPVKSDAIVVFLGPSNSKRAQEVRDLIRQKISGLVMVPASGNVFTDADIEGIRSFSATSEFVGAGLPSPLPSAKGHVERTHLEILKAKEMMTRLKIDSAVFVSSPYHMRRIKLICSRVFDSPLFSLTFVPSRYEEVNPGRWLFCPEDLKWVVKEYLKIAWFLAYYPLTRSVWDQQ